MVPGTPGQPARREQVAIQARRPSNVAAAAVEEGVAVDDSAEEAAEDGQRIVIDGPGVSPLLGRSLAEQARGMEKFGSTVGQGAGLAGRGNSLAHAGGTVEAIDIPAPPETRPPPGAVTGNPASWPKLAMPGAKPCQRTAAAEVTEGGTVQAGGLTASAFRRGVNTVATRAYQCFPTSTTGVVRAQAWIVAGCDGRVRRVEVESGQDLPEAVIGCVEHTLRHASFPAHGLPDGQEAMVPLTFRL